MKWALILHGLTCFRDNAQMCCHKSDSERIPCDGKRLGISLTAHFGHDGNTMGTKGGLFGLGVRAVTPQRRTVKAASIGSLILFRGRLKSSLFLFLW
jgi:hypothetical protein